MVHRAGADWATAEGPNMILDDGGDATHARPQGRRVRGRRRGAGSLDGRLRGVPGHPRACCSARSQNDAQRWTQIAAEHQGRHRGDHHRRPPPVRDAAGRQAAVPGHQRQRLGHQVQVRQPVRLPPLADRRHQPRHRRDDRRQGRRRLRLRRRRQGLRRVAARPGRPRHRHRDRPDLRAAGRDGGLPGRHARGRRRDRRHLHHRDRQQGHHHRRPHGPDEAPGDRRQHRPLRQRDRHGRPGQDRRASSRSTSSRRSTSGASPTATRSSSSPRAAC